MEGLLNNLVDGLEPIFKGLPPLPKSAKDWFVKAWPVLAVILGLLQILAAWSLWRVGHIVNSLITYSNVISSYYGNGVSVSRLGFFYWLALAVLIADAIIFFVAYSGLKAKTLAGWNFLFLAGLLNVIYGIFSAFDSTFDGVFKFLLTLICSAVGFYLLYQVRSYYLVSTKHKK